MVRIHSEKINGPCLISHGGSPEEYEAGLGFAVARDWLAMHETGVCTENLIRVDGAMESPKLAE
jgi:hypothetical protein